MTDDHDPGDEHRPSDAVTRAAANSLRHGAYAIAHIADGNKAVAQVHADMARDWARRAVEIAENPARHLSTLNDSLDS